MKALLRLYEGSTKALVQAHLLGMMQVKQRLSLSLAPALSMLYQDPINALSRLYYGSITALLRLYYGSIKGLGSIKAQLRRY